MDLRRTDASALALAALSAATAFAFAGLFTGDAWILPALGAVVAAHALGAVTRRRSSAIAVLTWAGGLLVYAIWVLAPATTQFGIPTGATFRELSHRLDAGLHAFREQATPVPARPGAVLVTVVAVWIMAAAADHLAFRRDASIGAVTPAVTLFIWTAALAAGSGHNIVAAAMTCTAAVFLAFRHQALLTQRRATVGSARRVPAPGQIVGSLALAVVAAGVALIVAPVLPGADAGPLIELRDDQGSSTYQTSVPPLVDVAADLRRGERVELFTVRASAPQYWRTVALDEYSGTAGGQWTLSASGADIRHGLVGTAPVNALEQTFQIGTLGERWMPAAYAPVTVDRADTLVIKDSLTLVTDAPTVNGLSYRVASAMPARVSTDAQRRGTAAAPPPELARDTEVPAALPASVRALAQTVTAGATNAYDRALLLRDFFRGPTFTYDTSVQLSDEMDATVAFLRDRRGFCVQFASTYALMARTLGIPARVAVGFTPGTYDPTTARYRVTNYEAHAWPEVYLPGIGWTNEFDPTPPSSLPGGSDLPGDTANPAVPLPISPPTTASPAENAPTTEPGVSPAPVPQARPVARPRSTAVTIAIVAVFVALLLVVGVVASVPAAKRRRRRARRRRAEPAARVAGAWEEALDRLVELGRAGPVSDTPKEVARAATPVVGARAAASLDALADTHTWAQFGRGGVYDDDAERAWRELGTFSDALGRQLGTVRRLRAQFAPGPLRTRARQAVPAGSSDARRSATKD